MESKNEENKEDKQVENNNEVKKEESLTENNPNNLIIMEKGDYTVHVLVEEVKHLKLRGDKQPLPVVSISTLGKSQRTQKITVSKGATEWSFGEHFYFDKQNMTEEMLDSEKIIINVLDSRHPKRKDYFGIYEFDFEYIYNRPNHALKNYWLALSNPESEEISTVTGFLKLSISVLNQKDPRVELEMNLEESNDCVIPPQIKLKFKQVSMYFFRAEDVPDMDSFKEKTVKKGCDGYIKVNYMGIERTTNIVKMMDKNNKHDVLYWNEIIDIPVPIPTVSQKITMTLYDDDFPKDDIVGSVEFFVQDILDGKYEDFFFAPVYGSYKIARNKICDIMNYNPEYGSRYKGKILMKITSKDIDNPTSGVRKIADEPKGKELIEYSEKSLQTEMWVLHICLSAAFLLPDRKQSYEIKISCFGADQPYYKSSTPNKWDKKNASLQLHFLKGIKDFPDVFIGLYKSISDNKCICFQRIPLLYFKDNYDNMLIKLLPEPSIGEVKGMKNSGLVKLKMCLVSGEDFNLNRFLSTKEDPNNNKSSSIEDFDDDDFEKSLTTKKVDNRTPHTIIACVYMSKELVAAESNGTSDPFVRLTLGDQLRETSVKYATINGIWNELLQFDNIPLDLNDKTTWPILLTDVLDKNKVRSDFPLGYNYVFLSGVENVLINQTEQENKNIKPFWHNLFQSSSNKQLGKILMKFYIFDQNNLKKIEILKQSKCYIPETFPYSCEMSILGLRQLKPLSLFPVKKAFIKFDMNSLNVTGDPKNSLKNIVTIPNDPGSNPTINSVIQFDIQLPKIPLFIPNLQCEVYDHILSGMTKSLLGVFTLDLQEIVKETVREISEDMGFTSKKFALKLISGKGKSNMFSNMGNILEKKYDDISKKEEEKEEELKIEEKTEEINTDVENKTEEIKTDVENKTEENKKDQILISTNSEGINVPVIKKKIRKKYAEPDVLAANIDDSRYFVQFARTTKYKIPGASAQSDKRLPREFRIEDEKKKPDPLNFMKLGYYQKKELKVEEVQIPKTEVDSKKENDINSSSSISISNEVQKIKKEDEEEYEDDDSMDEDLKEGKKKKFKPHPNVHYRRIYPSPLEDVSNKNFKLQSPFTSIDLRRGKYEDIISSSEMKFSEDLCKIYSKILIRLDNYGNKVPIVNVASRMSIKEEIEKSPIYSEKTQEAGRFKGLIKIAPKEELDKYKKSIAKLEDSNSPLLSDYKNYLNSKRIKKNILAKHNIYISIYILRLTELVCKDLFDNPSDPYIKIFLGDKEIVNEQKNYQLDKIDCDWYKFYQIPCVIPGASTIRIEVWDYDDFISDDFIGATEIDIEDRYFDVNWSNLVNKPIETRPLKHPEIDADQGKISLWLEINDQEEGILPQWNIQPEPPTKLECRFIVWDTEGMEMMDVEGTSDIYIIGYIDDRDHQSTDIHFRCQTGVASFNWRMLLPYDIPGKSNKIFIKVYDKDLFASDDYICGGEMNIEELAMIPKLANVPFKFNKTYWDSLTKEQQRKIGAVTFEDPEEDPEGIKFWIDCKKNNTPGGRVRCSLEILPKELADLNVVGKGRDDPNYDPYLPPPFGRIQFSLNPFKMLNQCVGPKFRRKMYCCICCGLLIAYLSFMLPHIGLNLANPFS